LHDQRLASPTNTNALSSSGGVFDGTRTNAAQNPQELAQQQRYFMRPHLAIARGPRSVRLMLLLDLLALAHLPRDW